MTIRIIVVDDSLVFRKIIKEALEQIADIEIIATAPDGKSALRKIREMQPDMVTLDIDMPGMSGLDVMDALRNEGIALGVLIVSALSIRGSDMTIKALEKGAFDFITKPSGASTVDENCQVLTNDLKPRILAFTRHRDIKRILSGNDSPNNNIDHKGPIKEATKNIQAQPHTRTFTQQIKPELVLIGVSTGGPVALAELLPKFPLSFPAPILIVQHMPPLFTKTLAKNLSEKCSLKIIEAESNTIPCPGTIYIAPGGKQMKLIAGSEKEKRIIITDDPPVNNCKPAVDYFFRSVAHEFPAKSIAVILTGMGSDGVLGLRLLKRNGCYIIAQDEATSVVYGMPGSAVKAGVVDEILALDKIPECIMGLINERSL